jgi:diguanylate cyclase (GGDEF)-like protein
MQSLLPIGAPIDQDEIKGFSRTIAEIEWLLLSLVLVYFVVSGLPSSERPAVEMALFLFAAFILGLHYIHFYKLESLPKLAAETWVMIVFVTWVAWNTGRAESPLLNLYLLPVIASALIFGKVMTFLGIAAIAACFVLLGWDSTRLTSHPLGWFGSILAQLGPVVLVAYITTMLSADIRNALNKIKNVSDTDELTGLYNMRAFGAILQRSLREAARHSQPLSLAMIDSDNLKAINDSYGHDAGNKLLVQLVNRIRDAVRTSDTIARYGGDEFLVLLPQTGSAGAVEVAERIRRGIEDARIDIGGHVARATVSVGVVTYPTDGGDLPTMMEKVDRALYKAKQAGRNRVVAHSDAQALLPFDDPRIAA